MQQLTINNRKFTTRRRAFTLIELLVVTTIIVILTMLVVLNLEKAQAKSRDAQRKADLSKIAAALEMYKVDNKQYTPQLSPAYTNITVSFLPTGYMATIPTDPKNVDSYLYDYKGDNTGSAFKIRAKSETITDVCATPADITKAKQKAGDFYNPPDCTYFQISTSITSLDW